MTIPIYDINTLPSITYPVNNTHIKTKKYLGGIAETREVIMELNIIATSDAEMEALYNFWINDCNYGLEPFLVPIPLFGRAYTPETPDLLARFIVDLSANKSSALWRSKIKIELLGTIDYVIDVNGDFIVSDTGEYVVSDAGDYVHTGNVINSYREVFYA